MAGVRAWRSDYDLYRVAPCIYIARQFIQALYTHPLVDAFVEFASPVSTTSLLVAFDASVYTLAYTRKYGQYD